MIYIIKHSGSKTAKYTMEEKAMRFIEKQLDISREVWEYDDGLKAVRKED